MIDNKYIDDVITQVSIEEVCCDAGVVFKKTQGHRKWACCPFHQEKTPSFCIDIATNKWHCFGECQTGGNVISFLMRKENLPFPIAVKKLLHEKLNIDIEDKDYLITDAEKERQLEIEQMRIINDRVNKFFVNELNRDNKESKAALKYAKDRWGENEKKFEELSIGYAPKTGFVEWAQHSGLDLEKMKEMGLLGYNEEKKFTYAAYQERITIPIRDKFSNIIGFTCRTTSDRDDVAKYKNSSTSLIYKKEQSIFGIDNAVREARMKNKMYCVEGAPDAMRLQLLGINNTVATLGGEWTEHQLDVIYSYTHNIVFIPDSEPIKNGKLSPGDAYVCKAGIKALNKGFTVAVREIPNGTDGKVVKKQDADSYFKDKILFTVLKDEEFLLWYLRKNYYNNAEEMSADTTENRIESISETCKLLVLIKDEDVRDSYLNTIIEVYQHKNEWQNGIKRAKKQQVEEKAKLNKSANYDMLNQFGFSEQFGGYWGVTKDGVSVQWSNFTLRPMFHIRDDFNPTRLFWIKNNDKDTPKRMIELNMEEITSSSNLRKRLFGMGNYIWMGKDEQMIKLLGYLGQVTETADPIKQLGYQRKENFYCFCNGAIEDGTWVATDEWGILRIKAGKFYLPALSKLYSDQTELYANEKKFRHVKYSNNNIGIADYFNKICTVFGDNAKVGLMFYIATVFHDIVLPKSRSFPILNVFGPKGCGKTDFAQTLMDFFYTYELKYEPLSITNASMPALSDYVASVSNALVHIDEYKNGIDIKKIEWLKDLWNGIGRSKMNMEKDKKRVQARVDSGIILTGQEMPTADIALFSRLIYLTFDRSDHTTEEKKRFNDMDHFRQIGTTHITIELLKHRDEFNMLFGKAWIKATADLQLELSEQNILDRIQTNWTIVLATYLAIKDEVDIPFTYDDLFNICVEGMKRQNSMCNSTDEIAGFWSIISAAQQTGKFVERQDYMIKTVDHISTSKMKDVINFTPSKRILMIRRDISLATYRKEGRSMDQNTLPADSLLHYLQIAPEFLGTTKNPERFMQFVNGTPVTTVIKDEEGLHSRKVWHKDRPLCFDYDQISKKYGIILDSETDIHEDCENNNYNSVGKGNGTIKAKINKEEENIDF